MASGDHTIAHKSLSEEVGVLHREINPSNMRLHGKEKGYLMDWDLSEATKTKFHDRHVSPAIEYLCGRLWPPSQDGLLT
ncbi:hypothetical protein BS17DRAFT_791918 [Gyrodon lividus]|nr:hypothetical protein BS17DRAFT_791918 [Gyrodon lividus]